MRRALLTLCTALVALVLLGRPVSAQVGNGPVAIRPWYVGSVAQTIFWLRADAANIPGASNGSKFSAWNDSSGAGRNFAQGTGANQYTWNAADATLGSQPSVTSIAASGMQLVYTAPTNISTCDVFYQTSNSSQFLYGTNPQFWLNSTTAYEPYGGVEFVFGTPDTNPHVICVVWGTSAIAYVDSSAASAGTGSTGTGHFATINLGYSMVASGLVGNRAEAIWFSGSLTQGQVAQVFAYAGARYGKTWK